VRAVSIPLIVLVAPALCALAADIAVRRDGPAFRVSGAPEGARVVVFAGAGDVPPVLGSMVAEGGDIVFRPRFEISPTVDCRVVVNGRAFPIPATKAAAVSSTSVEMVYPTTNQIPANQLKFYIHFSAPMRSGNAWDHLRLLDDAGQPVELAFLEIDQELWDRDGRRLTVLFDPGRIKRGVLPRDQVGAALVEGRRYTLVAGKGWPDMQGAPLTGEFRKTFRVVAEDRTAIEPAKWKIQAPENGTRNALVVRFGEPLDAALALRLISIPGVEGVATLRQEERDWFFEPASPWKPGTYEIAVDTALEDLAGNKVGRPFDVDTFERITTRSGRGIVKVPFRVEAVRPLDH